MRVVALLELRDEAGFDAEVLAYERVATQLGDPLYSWYVPLWRATRAYAQGRLEEARGLVLEARGVGERANSVNASMLGVVHSALVALDGRDPDEIERTWSAFGVLDRFAEPSVLVFRALVDARLGARTRARNTLERLGPEILQLIPLDQEWLASAGQLVESAVEGGLDEAVREAYAALLPYEDLDSFEGIAAYDHGLVGQYLALAAGYLGEPAAAVRHTERVLARSANAGTVVLAHTRANCARGLFATDDDAARARGHALAQEAIAAYDTVGLHALADELRALTDDTPTAAPPPTAALVREGETWAFTYAGTT